MWRNRFYLSNKKAPERFRGVKITKKGEKMVISILKGAAVTLLIVAGLIALAVNEWQQIKVDYKIVSGLDLLP